MPKTAGSFMPKSDSSSTEAANYTGSAGADTFIMANVADVINAGEGNDTLTVSLTAVLGGAVVDLSATDVVVQTNGSLNTTVQTGFKNVDLSGYTGGYGAVITANKDGSVITGTTARDQITGGAGNDTVKGTKAAIVTAGDVITFGAGTDTLEITDAASVDFSGLSFTGVEAIKVVSTASSTNTYVVNAGQFAAGAVSITGVGADADDDTLTIIKKTTNFEANAELSLAAVDIAGEWFFVQDSGDDGKLSYYNEEFGAVTTVTIVGLDAGAVTIVSNNLVFTA